MRTNHSAPVKSVILRQLNIHNNQIRFYLAKLLHNVTEITDAVNIIDHCSNRSFSSLNSVTSSSIKKSLNNNTYHAFCFYTYFIAISFYLPYVIVDSPAFFIKCERIAFDEHSL